MALQTLSAQWRAGSGGHAGASEFHFVRRLDRAEQWQSALPVRHFSYRREAWVVLHPRASLPANFSTRHGSKGFGSDRGSGSERSAASGYLIPQMRERQSQASSDEVRGGKATHVS